jgi:hypothetical protein
MVIKGFSSNATEYQRDMVDENKLSSVAKLGFGS